MKNIILLAPPAAGKGTQSNLLIEKYGLAHISTGDLLRESLNEETDLSKQIKECMNSGKLVNDEIILDLIKNRISKDDCKDGCILDGYPRNINQAISLDKLLKDLNRNINYVLYLNIDKDILRKRIVGRLSCPNCKAIYNDQIENMNSKISGICDLCNTALTRRDDDNEATFENRYSTYMNETEPLVNYYKEQNVLYEISNSESPEEVFAELVNIIDNN